MKIIITLIVIGAVMRLPVNEDITWLRDLTCIILLLAGILMPLGDYYGISIIATLGALAILNLIYNISYDKFKVEKVEELEQQIRDNNYLIFNLEEELKVLQESQAPLKKYKEEDMVTINLIISELFEKMSEEEINLPELKDTLIALKEIVGKPIIIKRSAYDFNLECRTNRQRRSALRRIKAIKKEFDLGIEFDMQLDEMTNKLERGMK